MGHEHASADAAGGPAIGHARAHLRRRGLRVLSGCELAPGEDAVLALDPATGSLVLALVSARSASAPPVRIDSIRVTLDDAGELGRLEHSEGRPQSASCW